MIPPAPPTVEEMCETAADLLRTDLDAARSLAAQAEAAALRSSEPRPHAFALRTRALVEFASNRYAAALELFERALAGFERSGDPLEAARTRSNAIQTLTYLSRYDQALDWAAKARATFEQRGELLRLARLDGNIANLLYRQDRLEESIALYEDVCVRLRQLGRPRDVAAVLRNKAVCELSLSRFDAALETHREARAFCIEHGMTPLVAEADYNIAYLYFLRGDYLTARELYQQAREQARASGDLYHAALCDLDQAEMALELNLSGEGAQLSRRALRAFLRLGLGYEAAKAQVFAGLAAGQMGEWARALADLGRARRRFAAEQNAIWPPLIDMYAALLLEKLGRYGKAREKSRSALGFFSPAVLPGKAIVCRLLLARLDLATGRIPRARVHARAASRLLAGAQSPALSGSTWHLMGRIQHLEGDHAGAAEFYRNAQREFEALRDRLRTEESRISFFKDKSAAYEDHFLLLVAAGQVEDAFALAERAKSRVFAKALAPRRPGAQSSITEPEQLCQELDAQYRALEEAVTAGRPEALTRENAIRARIARAEAALREVQGRSGAWGLNTVAEIQAMLPDGARMLEYFQAGDNMYGFLVSRTRVFLRDLGPARELLGLVRLVHFHMARAASNFQGSLPGIALPHLLCHLRELHHRLIEPFPLAASGDLYVIPHAFLHTVPFHALHDGARYLGERFPIVSAPCAGAWRECLTLPRNAGGQPLVLAVPDHLAPLIAEEAAVVAKHLPGARVFLGPEATRHRLREFGAGSVVHIATHGRFRGDNPWFSSIKLGDSDLILYDLCEMRLPADLVVLSGCATGSSVVMGGHEAVGLIRGLLRAGARSALVSLWSVSDQSTRAFMEAFYEQVSSGKDLARSLQLAQARTRERFEHPFHWAPFALVGNGGPIFS